MSFIPRIPKGSCILITGVNGLVASHVADQCLKAGYRVRGTVRDPDKASWMKDRFGQYGKSNFELVAVDDMAADGAFDDAVKGVSGVAHVASIVGLLDPNDMIPGVVAGAMNMMIAAAKEKSVKAVVYTSSSWAAASPAPNVRYHIDATSWNETAVKAAWAPPPYTADRLMDVYAASKVEAEKQCWTFMREQRPRFTFNTVLPAANFGKVIDVTHQGYPSTIGWVKDLFLGIVNVHPFVPPQYFVDTADVGRIHLAAIIDPAVQNERILSYQEPYTWNKLLNLFRRMYPERVFIDNLADQGQDLSTVDNSKASEMLGRTGTCGFTELEQSIKWTVETLA